MSTLSLPRRLAQHADRSGDQRAILFRAGNDWEAWTWGEYWDRTRRMARGLRAAGVGPGDRVLVVSPDVKSAVTCQLGAWTAGAIPAQLGVPDRLTNVDRFIDQLHPTLRQLDTNILLVDRSVAASAVPRSDVRMLVAEDLMEQPPDAAPDSQRACGALMQLTSGSTGHPRAVLVPHDRLVRHLESISTRLPSSSLSAGVSWLPVYHDMGLIGGLLYPCFNGFPVYVFSPLDFRRNPYAWLQTMSRVRATHTSAPPSGYAIGLRLAARAVDDRLDLSALGCAMIGAEPIPPRLVRQFADAFAPCGFRPEAFFPVYGLAEATVAVTFPEPLTPTRIDAVDRDRFEREGHAVPPGDEAPRLEFVGAGSALSGTELSLRDDQGHDLPERRVGEIWIRSDSLMEGYYGDADATAAVLKDGWLDTGDLGYIADGALFVTGRSKDLIIARGRNLVPSTIEEIVSSLSGVRKDCVAAVGVPSQERATECVCVVAETRAGAGDQTDIAAAVRDLLKLRGINVDHVILVPPRTLPRTSSGKIKRRLIVQQLQSGLLADLRQPIAIR
ncbi:MAG TPA: AMP-binding protein [Vicinamibacterales bacterium]|nr:AMP-binding protein [Vicinamibacterales bacterium]